MNLNEVIQPPQNIMASNPIAVTDQDVRQIESLFSSLKTKVFVCPALSNLYFATLQDMANLGGWELATSGFPTLVMTKSSNMNLQERTLQLCIAERGTGFVLWKDTLNVQSNYKAPGKNFHTLTVSKDHKKIAGLSFDDQSAACQLQATVEAWIKDVTPEETTGKKKKKDKKRAPKPSKSKPLNKHTISQPCCFEHITQLDHESFIQRMTAGMTGSNPSQGLVQQQAAVPGVAPASPTETQTMQTVTANIGHIPPAPALPPPSVPVVPTTIVESVTKSTMAYAESTSTEDSGLDEPAALSAEAIDIVN